MSGHRFETFLNPEPKTSFGLSYSLRPIKLDAVDTSYVGYCACACKLTQKIYHKYATSRFNRNPKNGLSISLNI